MNKLSSVILVMTATIIWFGYPPLAFWVSEKIPFAHFLMLPGSSPTLPMCTIILATGTYVCHRSKWFGGITRMVAIFFGIVLGLWWIYVIGWWVLIWIKNGE